MKRRQIEMVAFVFMAAITAIATGQVPQRMSFQCILTNASGVRQTGTFSVVFTIYDAATGGSALWSETHPAVNVTNGLCQVVLGSGNPSNPLPLNLFDGAPRFLGIRVGNDAEMTPRQEMMSVPSSFRAQSSVTGGGITRINQGRKIIVDNQTGPIPTINVAPNSIDDDDIRDNSLSPSSIGPDAVGSEELQARVTFSPNGSVEIGNNSNQLVAHIAPNSAGGGAITVDTPSGNTAIELTTIGPANAKSGFLDVRNPNGVEVVVLTTDNSGANQQHGDILVLDGAGRTRTEVALDENFGGAIQTLTADNGRAILVATAGGSGSSQAGFFQVLRPDGFTPELEVDGSGGEFGGIFSSSPISLRMEHPLDAGKEIHYATLEGPEAGLYVRGTARLANGQAQIQLPDHFAMVAQNEGLTVSLTPLSASSEGLAVISKSTREIVIRELRNGAGNYEFDYIVHGIRSGREKFQAIRNKADFMKKVAMPPVDQMPAQDAAAVASPSGAPQDNRPPRE